MNLSALRIRIVITYLHCPEHSEGQEPSMDDKEEDKRQCELYVANALKVGSPAPTETRLSPQQRERGGVLAPRAHDVWSLLANGHENYPRRLSAYCS